MQQQQQHQTKTKPIETQTLAGEQTSIQDEDITKLKSVITKTIENNNENVKELQEIERKAATERVILTDSFDENNGFEPIVETFSEDDAIVIKPKQTADERPAEAQESDYVIEDNTNKNGKLATIDIDNDKHKTASTVLTKANEPTSNEFDDSNINNNNNNNKIKGFDDVTISLDTPKVRFEKSIPSTYQSIYLCESNRHNFRISFHFVSKFLLHKIISFFYSVAPKHVFTKNKNLRGFMTFSFYLHKTLWFKDFLHAFPGLFFHSVLVFVMSFYCFLFYLFINRQKMVNDSNYCNYVRFYMSYHYNIHSIFIHALLTKHSFNVSILYFFFIEIIAQNRTHTNHITKSFQRSTKFTQFMLKKTN